MITRRKLVCGTCGTSKNSANGQTLYMLGTSEASLMSLPNPIECYDCGEKRRDEEERKKQDRNKSLVDRFAEESDKLKGISHKKQRRGLEK